MKLTVLFAAILVAASHFALFAAEGIIERRDAPIQTTWFLPKKAPSTKSHEGLFRADTFSWRCSAIIRQTFRRDKKWLLLRIDLDGPGNWSTNSSAIFAVDGDVVTIPFGIDSPRSLQMLGGNRGVEITLHGQESLISRIAAAGEVWVTIPDGNSGSRHSVKLSEPQRQIFREILDRYGSL